MPAREPRQPGRVSVVIATRDRRDGLLATLERLRALPERPEVVVVDNGSCDGTPAAVAARAPWAGLVALGRNAGAAARTAGARAVATRYVAFSDDDSWWEPGALGRAVAIMDADPRVALVAGRVLVGPEGREDPVCRAMAASPLPAPPGAPGPPVLGFVACGAVVRRDDFLAAGGFHERLGVRGEEELLALDLTQAGRLLVYVPEVVARHHPAPGRDPGGRRRVQARNALWCAWLRRPAPAALRATARAAAAAARDRAARRGLLDAVAGGGWIAARRRPVDARVERLVRLLERQSGR